LVIAPTSDEATERFDRQAATGGWRSGERAATLAGSPAAVAAQVGSLVDVGVDGVVVTMADAHQLELVELAGTTLRPLLG
jgi:alkanesulfonate monooxygenase SsuD/methylene tetrahydromethanopterin reductase-like flavin-dependent oxidoreductase (luciferase family)